MPMPCAAFEDLLQGYDALPSGDRRRADSHLAVCADCRDYMETLADLDRKLTGLYADCDPRAGFAARAIAQARAMQKPAAQPRRPSAWPEVLDFCGWAAIMAIVSFLAVTAAAHAGITLKFPPHISW
jgi:predicted anti-sigma-YlaC factor YlaD